MGVTVETISAGDGVNFPKPGQTVHMHYTGKDNRLSASSSSGIVNLILSLFFALVGTLLNGSKFDSSVDRGQPFVTKIGVGQVIKGWDEGVPQLSLGQKAKLICTPDYAYGSRAMGSAIPANSTLIFEVELLKIV